MSAAPSSRRAMRRGRTDSGLLRGVVNGLLWALIAVVVLVAGGAVLLPRILGGTSLTVLTGSMEPALAPGDMIVVVPVDPPDVRIGQVISFHPFPDDPTLITHRVIAVGTDGTGETSLLTQGDANSAADEPIRGEQIAGRVAYSLPKIGYLASALQGESGRAVVLWTGIGAIALGASAKLVNGIRRRAGAREPGAGGPR